MVDDPPFSASRQDGRRTVWLTHEFAPFYGGAATYAQETAAAAWQAGYNVSLVTVNYQGRGFAASAWEEVAALRLPFPVHRARAAGRLGGVDLVRFAWALGRRPEWLRDADVLLMSAGAHQAAALLAAAGRWPRDSRAVAFFHGSELLRFGRSAFWRRRLRAFYDRHLAAAAVASEYVRGLARGAPWWNDGSAPLWLAPCALPTLLRDAAESPPGMAAPPGAAAAGRAVRLLTVARLHPRKGQLELIKALGELAPRAPAPVIYTLVGTGAPDHVRAIRRAARESGVTVQLLGARPTAELPAIYRAHDLFVLPSRALPGSVEGFGIVCLEANAFGLPVLACRTGGVGQAVQDGVTGRLVPPDDFAALARNALELWDDPARVAMSRACVDWARRPRWIDAARTLCQATRKGGRGMASDR